MDGDQGYARALFIQPVENDIICPVCMNVCRDAVVCKDGHSFCKDCLARAMEANYNRCPMDRSYLGVSAPAKNRALDGIISKLMVKCKTTLGGCSACQWSGPLESLQNHNLQCTMVVVKCTNTKCTATMYKFELDRHKEYCPFKTTACKLCSEPVIEAEMENHRLLCLGQNVHCPNNCQESITRGQLPTHMMNYCQKEVHSCPLKCGKTMTSPEVAEHFTRHRQIHLQQIVQQLMAERLSLVKQEPITMNPIVVEWDVNLKECNITEGVSSPRYNSAWAELQIIAKGDEMNIDVFLNIRNKIELPSILTSGIISILKLDCSKSWKKKPLKNGEVLHIKDFIQISDITDSISTILCGIQLMI